MFIFTLEFLYRKNKGHVKFWLASCWADFHPLRQCFSRCFHISSLHAKPNWLTVGDSFIFTMQTWGYLLSHRWPEIKSKFTIYSLHLPWQAYVKARGLITYLLLQKYVLYYKIYCFSFEEAVLLEQYWSWEVVMSWAGLYWPGGKKK